MTRIALSSSLGLAAGCTSEHAAQLSRNLPEPQDDASMPRADSDSGSVPSPAPKWQSISCNEHGPELLLGELAARGVDYIGLLQAFPGGQNRDTGQYLVTVRTFTQSGEPCATAPDASACDSASSTIMQPSAACTSEGKCGPFVLVGQGGELQRIDTRSALLHWLGDNISSGEQAVLLGLFDGHDLACPNQSGGPGTETRATDEGFDVQTISTPCRSSTPSLFEAYHVSEDATVTQIQNEPWRVVPGPRCTGRRPAGLRALRADCHSDSALSAFFASAAQLEAASVFAFARLARELHALQAPAPLLASAVSALSDELRHARLVAALAQRFGARVQAPEIAPMPARKPFAIALENAVEGCVRESYGALLAQHQAISARDPQIKWVMSSLARDEAQHAMLAWQLAAWLEPRLTHSEQLDLACARRAALAELSRELDSGLLYADEHLIGWPTRAEAEQLLLQLTAALA